MKMLKVLSTFLCVLMIASLAVVAVSAAQLGQPSIQASSDLEEQGPALTGDNAASISVVAVKDAEESVEAALEEIEKATSIYNLVPMAAIKASMGIEVEGDLSEKGLAVFTAFGLQATGTAPVLNAAGRAEVTLGGLSPESFRYFTFIYLPEGPVTSASAKANTLLASSEWKVLEKENIKVNEDGTVTLAIDSYGTYVMVTSNGEDLVNPFTADSMWWIFVVAGVAVIAIATGIVIWNRKQFSK